MSEGKKVANWYDLEKSRIGCYYSYMLWSEVYEAGASEEQIKKLREYYDEEQWAEYYELHRLIVDKKNIPEGVKK